MKWATTIAEIPGYLEAVAKEQIVRDTAFLCEREKIQGFTVQPVSLRIYGELRLAESPFIPPFRTPTVDETIIFLWRLNPTFNRERTGKHWRQFLNQVQVFLEPSKPIIQTKRAMLKHDELCFDALVELSKVVTAARTFMESQLWDKPEARKQSSEPDVMSDIAGIIARLARAYSWSEQTILDMPMARVFQYLKDCRANDYLENVRGGLSVDYPVQINPSDKIVGDYMAAMNKKRN